MIFFFLFATAFKIDNFLKMITKWRAIQKRKNESMYKTDEKLESKMLRATNFSIAKLEEQ